VFIFKAGPNVTVVVVVVVVGHVPVKETEWDLDTELKLNSDTSKIDATDENETPEQRVF
jgi:hypothetical protein